MKELFRKWMMAICPAKHYYHRSEADIDEMVKFLKEYPTLDIPVQTRVGIVQGINWMRGMNSTVAYQNALTLLCGDEPSVDTIHVIDRYSKIDVALCGVDNDENIIMVPSRSWERVTCKFCLNLICIYSQMSKYKYNDFSKSDIKDIIERIMELTIER